MRLDETHPLNAGVLRFLRGPGRIGWVGEPLIKPDQHPDPYMRAGAHPDIVQRLWDTLGPSLSADCRALVYGTPVLVHPDQGVVLAVSIGTQYAIRVPPELQQAAFEIGCSTEQTWAGGEVTKIEEALGRGWVFGCWADEEKQWLAQLFRQCATPHDDRGGGLP